MADGQSSNLFRDGPPLPSNPTSSRLHNSINNITSPTPSPPGLSDTTSMKQNSTDSNSFADRIRSAFKAHGNSSLSTKDRAPTLPVSNTPTDNPNGTTNIPPFPSSDFNGITRKSSKSADVANNTSADTTPAASHPQVEGEGTVVNSEEAPKKKNVAIRFWLTGKGIICSSWFNLLLVFVPIGIAAKAVGLSPGIIFAMNAIAIVPLAGLLSHATESVAKRMGDTIGALMNVTFGNAVELIILIALQKNEIRIVQASLLGSILANLLLILGMCFLIGGLRFREQIYNSTVTQMSACLLSLSVMSLLLPTAFHASFSTAQSAKATRDVLKVSRGTSVVLLLVYAMYLLFQLKSHAYMYESTPQRMIDEELAPGPVAQWMQSSDDDSSSSSSSDSDSSTGSDTTAKKFKRVMRGGRRRRKSSFGSKETAEAVDRPRTRASSIGTGSAVLTTPLEEQSRLGGSAVDVAEDGDDEDARRSSRKGSWTNHRISKKERRKERDRKRHEKKQQKKAKRNGDDTVNQAVDGAFNEKAVDLDAPRRVDFAVQPADAVDYQTDSSQRRPFNIRNMRPQIPKSLSQNVFMGDANPVLSPATGPIPRVRYGVRHTNSLPDLRNQQQTAPANLRILPSRVNSLAVSASKDDKVEEEEENISRTTAICILLISTGLVALCAEFMVDSINAVVASNSGISEAFIGLIILPIVGNAAEHVTAVTVANKNKMDLAIGVAVGSSIQIALFVTPFVVLLGWAMGKEMSLYFTLFETVCLFVSAFIVNFLVLDGRSNYLEGALLCAAYVIIAVAAFFYPSVEDQSNLGGNADAVKRGLEMVLGL